MFKAPRVRWDQPGPPRGTGKEENALASSADWNLSPEAHIATADADTRPAVSKRALPSAAKLQSTVKPLVQADLVVSSKFVSAPIIRRRLHSQHCREQYGLQRMASRDWAALGGGIMPGVTRRQVLGGASAVAGMALAGAAVGIAVRQHDHRRGISRVHTSTKVAKSRPAARIWTSATGSLTNQVLAAADGVVCVGCEDRIVGLSMSDGRKTWSLAGSAAVAPTVLAGVVYATAISGVSQRLYALRASDGMRLRSFAGGGAAVLAGSGGVAYVSDDSGLHALRAGNDATLEDVWSLSGDWTVQMVSGRVVFADQGGREYALDARDGRRMWSIPGDRSIQLVSDGLAYVGPGDAGAAGVISAVRVNDGTLVWNSAVVVSAEVQFIAGNVVYLCQPAYQGGTMYALRLSDGTTLWKFDSLGAVTDGSGAPPPLTASTSVAYLGAGGSAAGEASSLHALRTSTGTRLWSMTTPGADPPKLTLSPAGVYVSDGGLSGMGMGGGGRVSSVRATDGAAIWTVTTGGQSPDLTVADGVIYATDGVVNSAIDTTTGSNVFAMRAGDGAPIWDLAVPYSDLAPGITYGAELAVADHVAYVGSGDGTVSALRT
jgi:outer membrane protein assembly factor BamB